MKPRAGPVLIPAPRLKKRPYARLMIERSEQAKRKKRGYTEDSPHNPSVSKRLFVSLE
jgi:hypothetical protein